MTEIEPTLFKETPSIKIIKNTKGYNWEIKILELDVEKIAKLDSEMREKFGNEIL